MQLFANRFFKKTGNKTKQNTTTDATTLAADLERLGESETIDGFLRTSQEVIDTHYAALNRVCVLFMSLLF